MRSGFLVIRCWNLNWGGSGLGWVCGKRERERERERDRGKAGDDDDDDDDDEVVRW